MRTQDTEPTWPCPSCGAGVAMTLDECSVCGAGFLEQARQGHSLNVPYFGKVGKLDSNQRLFLGIGVGLALLVALVILATVAGELLK